MNGLAPGWFLAAIAIGACPTTVLGQGVLWDNGRYDESSNLASMRNPMIEAWTVDDIVIESDVVITGYRWYSVLRNRFEPTGADIIILTEGFAKVIELRDVPVEVRFVGEVMGVPRFQMDLENLSIGLPRGHYYLGARPVSDREGDDGYTLLTRTISGVTAAYFRSVFFGYPEWTSILNIHGSPFDIGFTVFGQVVREEVRAASLTIRLGRHLGGEISDLHQSDDRYVTIRDRALMAMSLPMIRMEVEGTTAVETASRITVTVETAASGLPNQPLQRLALFDYIAGQWTTIDERAAPPVDTVVEIVVVDDPARFIAPGAGQLKMRLDWFDPGATTPWGVRIDHATWTVER